MNSKDEIKFKIGKVCVSTKIDFSPAKERVREHYKEFIATEKPDLYIDTKYKDFQMPNFDNVLCETRTWKLTKEADDFLFYFPGRGLNSLAKFNSKLKKIDFYTQDSSGQLLLYLLPEIIFLFIMPEYQSLMLHACGIVDKEKGYLFIGPTDGGKSTIAKLANRCGLEVLNDDRIIIEVKDRKVKIYGSPWHGEVESISSKSINIEEVFFIKKSDNNRIQSVNKTNAVTEFFKSNFYLPINHDIIKKNFNMYVDLAKQLNCYYFHFKPDKNIWSFLNERFK